MECTESYRIIYNDDNNNNNEYYNIATNPLHQALQFGNIHLVEILSRDPNMLTCVDSKTGHYPLPRVQNLMLNEYCS